VCLKGDVLTFALEDDINLKGLSYDEAKTMPKYKLEQKEERLKTLKFKLEKLNGLICIVRPAIVGRKIGAENRFSARK